MEEGVIIGSGDNMDQDPDLVLIQVRIPDLHAEKCLQFSKEERVWDVKQQILAAMPKVSVCLDLIYFQKSNIPYLLGHRENCWKKS